MTGMGRPKHYVPLGKWTWIILLIYVIICLLVADYIKF
jgi:hypothetical protein